MADQRSSYASVLASLALESCRTLGAVAVTAKSSVSVARKKVPVAVFRQVLHQLVDTLGRLLHKPLLDRLSHGPDDRFRACIKASVRPHQGARLK